MDETTEWLRVPAARPRTELPPTAEEHTGTDIRPHDILARLALDATRLAALQGTERPRLDKVSIQVFAADHGAALRTARWRALTAERIADIAHGRAAVGLFARGIGAGLEVLNLGTFEDPGPLEGVRELQIGPGTADSRLEPAMRRHQLARAMHAGRHAAERARLAGAQIFIGGALGSGSTTAARTLGCALTATGSDPAARSEQWRMDCAPETSRPALEHHGHHLDRPLEALRRLGGFELAALTGSYMACAHMGLPVLVDGIAGAAAALTALSLCPGARDWLLFSHASPDPHHRLLLDALRARPLLELPSNSEDGRNAAALIPLLRLACLLHGAGEIRSWDGAGWQSTPSLAAWSRA